MDTRSSVPSEVEPSSIEELVADCVELRRALSSPSAEPVVVPSRLTIPERAVAVVAELDAYGD